MNNAQSAGHGGELIEDLGIAQELATLEKRTRLIGDVRGNQHTLVAYGHYKVVCGALETRLGHGHGSVVVLPEVRDQSPETQRHIAGNYADFTLLTDVACPFTGRRIYNTGRE